MYKLKFLWFFMVVFLVFKCNHVGASPVAMDFYFDGGKTGFCNGTIVGKKLVLTARHCIAKWEKGLKPYTVFHGVGVLKFYGTTKWRGYVVKKYIGKPWIMPLNKKKSIVDISVLLELNEEHGLPISKMGKYSKKYLTSYVCKHYDAIGLTTGMRVGHLKKWDNGTLVVDLLNTGLRGGCSGTGFFQNGKVVGVFMSTYKSYLGGHAEGVVFE